MGAAAETAGLAGPAPSLSETSRHCPGDPGRELGDVRLESRSSKEIDSRELPGSELVPSFGSAQETLLHPDTERINGWISYFSFLWHIIILHPWSDLSA